MNNHVSRKKTDNLLKNLKLYESYAEYYDELVKNSLIPERKLAAAKQKAEIFREMVRAAKRAISLLSDTERNVVNLLYFEENTAVEDVCDILALERSSVYRYRASALDKIAIGVVTD